MLLIHSFLWLFISFFSCIEIVSAADHCSPCEGMSFKNDLIELHVASYQENLSSVWQLLQEGADVNEMDKSRFTALHIAALNGNAKLVNLLLQCGASSFQDDDGRNPLHYAIYYGYTSIVELLAENVQSLDEEDLDGNRPLHTAIINKKDCIVKILLEKSALVNKKNKSGWTALDIAILYDSDDMVKLLRAFGALTNFGYSSNCARTLFPVDQSLLKEYERKSEKVSFSLLSTPSNLEPTKSLLYTDEVFCSY